MQNWEYQVVANIRADGPAFIAADLNMHGRSGWELVSLTVDFSDTLGAGLVAVFKRPIRS